MIPPPSPGTLARNYRNTAGPEQLAESDEATASFDTDALKKIASQVMGKACSGFHRIAEGNYNQVFVIIFEDGSDIVARVNVSSLNEEEDEFSSLEMLENRSASEAATLTYLLNNTRIPVPIVHASNHQTDNPVHARYMLQERVIGQPLAHFVKGFTPQQREAVVTQLAQFEVELLKIPFSCSGSIFKETENGGYGVSSLVPHLIPEFAMLSHRGPWQTFNDMLKSFALNEFSYISQNSDKWKAHRESYINAKEPDPPLEFMKTFYQILLSVIEATEFKEPQYFLLKHVDFAVANILVAYDEPTRVVGVLDWEGSSVVPSWFWDPFPLYIMGISNDNEERQRLLALRDAVVADGNESLLQEECDGMVQRDLLQFFIYQNSLLRSPKEISEEFGELWECWPEDMAEAFRPLLTFIEESVGYHPQSHCSRHSP